jgi:Sulfotransferase family
VVDQPAPDGRPLLVAGAPRTGTTWIAQVLSRAEGVGWINEPDNEWPNTYALKAKLTLGRFPALTEGDAAPRRYEELWRRSLAGFRQGRYQEKLAWKLDQKDRTMQELWQAMCDHANPRLGPRLRVLAWLARPPATSLAADRVMVKSVHAPLALEWISARVRPRILVVQRHPFSVIASWLELGWGGCALEANPRIRERFGQRWSLPELDADASRLQRLAWEVGLFTCAARDGADRHPDWLSVSHEDLCTDPIVRFRSLFEHVGYPWSPAVEDFLNASDRPGEGWSGYRVAAEQPDRWRLRLDADQVREAWSILSRFGAPWVEAVAADLS